MSDNPSRTVLETLIDTVYDSLNGYRNASDAADSQAVKSAFANQMERRQSTLDMLNQELVRQGGELVTTGTMAGGLHQVWLKVTALFQSGDRAAIDRVQEGEDYLAGKFETALEGTDLDSQTRAIIQRALTEIRQGEQLAKQLGRVGDSTFGQ